MVKFVRTDLDFILEQIKISERHAAGEDLLDILPNVQVPWGLRTISGAFNNLTAGDDQYGAADNLFPRLLPAEWRNGDIFGSYESPGTVRDSSPRTISNLIVDQSTNNPAAVATAAGVDGSFIIPGVGITGNDVHFIPNVAPDEGLSAPFNSWMTFFGQFFSHGLDLVTKGGNENIIIPLAPDDPLFVPGRPNFLILTRATQFGAPGQNENTTSPFVDQNQTYSSHPSHQVFLREYEQGAGGALHATGRLIEGAQGGMATWADVKEQARVLLGINLTDANVFDVPLLVTDQYGNFIPGANGFPQVVMQDGSIVEGDPLAPVSLANAVSTLHQFLIDIAHGTSPFASNGSLLLEDVNTVAGGAPPAAGFYDDELLDAHYMAGDGRVNENIGLTAVHHIFHSEHNRLVEHIKDVIFADAQAILAEGGTQAEAVAFLNEWLRTDIATLPANPTALVWDGERVFQAAKFATEMQYQHLVFEEFARTIQPNVDEFLAPNGYDTTIDASIVAEFAHTVYRFGHSMLTETMDRLDPNFVSSEIGLIEAFLNPLAFAASGVTADQAAGAIARGVTRQVGNAIDEFVTEALRNNLVGLPLDLAAINIARGRDTGIPSLNSARAQFYEMTGDSQLKPYTSWVDFLHHIKHPESLVNFIAAYGTHATITAETTVAGKRAAALAIVLGGAGASEDRDDFLNGAGAYAADLGGLNLVDFWIGGLAEETMPFGGMLGSTFNFVFETQLEALQDGDRFYYLARNAGLNFLAELENNSFSQLVMRNTDLTHLPDVIFTTPAFTLEVDQSRQYTGLGLDGRADPTGGIEINGVEISPLVSRDNPHTAAVETNYLKYIGGDHVVIGGTSGNDTIISSIGDDTLWGDEGDDYLEGGDGVDTLLGGDGDDILVDKGGDDVFKGGDGNDVINAGKSGAVNLILGQDGNDFIVTPRDITEIFGGDGNDFILGALVNEQQLGGAGDDWIEGGAQDGAPGDNFSPILADNLDGHDVFLGTGSFDEYIGEGGDDIMVGSGAQDKMEGDSGFDWVTYKLDRFGVVVDMRLPALAGFHTPQLGPFTPFAPSEASLLDRFFEVEGLSGSAHADLLRGDDLDLAAIVSHGDDPGRVSLTAEGIARIAGLQDVLGAGVTSFVGGNIILGGSGSDIIEGNGGDDIIHGDKWLNVRISVRANPDGSGAEIATFDSMDNEVLLNNMFTRVWNPGQLVIVREVLDGADDYDTAGFAGPLANYTIAVNGDVIDPVNGPFNFADDAVVTVTDNTTGEVDTLRGIERLQFGPDATTGVNTTVVLQSGNAAPVGDLVIIDVETGLPLVGSPSEGDLLRVDASGVTDADIAGGAITGRPVSFVWQVERDPGTGVYEDIVLLPAGDLAFQSADGTHFRLTPDLEGLAIRVRGIYQDDNGTSEQVFSAPTAPVLDVPVTPVTPVADVEPNNTGPGIFMSVTDLRFILDQIEIAEAHADGAHLLTLVPNVRTAAGLRTVTGEYNNLYPDQSQFGAADNPFPRLLDPEWRMGEDSPDLNPGPGVVIIPAASYNSPGIIFDSTPRMISNLIVDQTANNPAAVAAAGDTPEIHTSINAQTDAPSDVFFIPNTAPDEGLSAPFNSWMTFFGQFFDHGLDLVTKGGNETIIMPLAPDDPLFNPLSPTNFLVLTRATQGAGGPGDNQNTTSPMVDQNQTYTSHPSHQVFLREYVLGPDGAPHATGELIKGANGGMATWGDLKAQARDILGIDLTDLSVGDVPLLLTDYYGNFIPGANGFPQVVMTDASVVEGNLATPVDLTNAVSTLHQFIIDIAHNANPFADTTGALGIPDGVADTILTADANTTTDAVFAPLAPGEYDNELLDAHFIAGDGRVNENIALTAVHHVFHSEHNRMVAQVKNTIAASGDLAFINEWLLDDITTLPVDQAAIDDLVANGSWDGERLFQVAKFSTEMQYQHLVFEEFARTIQPTVDPFFAATQVYDIDIDPSIVAEFAHTVYRFGHSMLTETVDRLDANFASSEIGLIQAFLNPTEFDASGTLSAEEAAGAIARGVTRQVGNEIDEFVTTALRNNLLGLPLDLAAINIARGRDTGIPSLNNARAQFFAATQDTQLKPYESWVEFMENIKHPESIINFIAAYGTHNTITGATTLADKRAAATLLVLGGAGEPTDRFDFLHATGTWDGIETGLNLVDFWIGGLAEAKEPFGGFLGSTFNFVFEYQMEVLQNADRFYYLERTAGLPFLTALEANSFARMITANTNATHLPGNVFLTPAYTLEVDQSQQYTGLGPDGRADPTGGIEIGGTELLPLVLRGVNSLEYTGGDHVVLGGTANNDTIISSIGDDTIYGDGGDDNLEGGYGNDTILGGAGDDVLTDIGGDDLFQGEDGNDVIQGGNGVNLIIGGAGNDFIILGEDANEGFGGFGTDFILGTRNTEATFGGEGDDWIEAGTTDGGSGDNFDPLGADPVPGNDIFIGRGENDKFQAEGGDDIMFGSPGMGDRYIGGSGFDWASFKSISETFLWGVNQGVTIDIRGRFFDQPVAPGGPNALSRFDIVEGLSGSSFADYLQGDDEDATSLRTAGALGSVLTQLDLIEGLRTFVETALGGPVDFFDGGNIIFGGAGSDILEGRGGDDLLDGDRWLDVYISVRENNDGTGAEIAAFESMVPLVPLMLDRVYNPGQLTIQRIIRDDDDSFDTAVFTGLLSEYTISTVGGVTTVTDLSLTPRDGTDRLINIEKLQFADQAVILNGAGNNVATGSLAFIDDTTEVPNLTPSTGDVLRVTLGTVADLDGIVSTYRIAYFWQVENVPGSGVFTDIEVDAAGEFARVRGDTFEVTDAYEGLRLRVRAVFVDGEGNLEEVYTPASKAVNAPATGAPAISDTTPTVGFAITANPGTIADPNGLITAVFTYQWQQGVVGGGGPFTNIVGATGASFTPTAAQGNRQLRVVATFTDDDGNLESRASAAAITGVNVLLDPGNDTFTGTGGQDIINGEGGNDTLNGGAEDDQLIGGAGNDMLTGGTGADTMTGGAGDDIFQVENAGDVVVENANEGIDQVRASITYTLGANVENLQLTGAAAINGTGNGLNNVIVGNSAANVLSGLGGDDTIQGGGGADTYIGGTGNDIYIVANAGITITEAANEGTDTVRASVTTTLSADVENLVLTGTADINGTGNGLNNTINGNNGVNVIQGNDGNDTINAAGGNDIINGGAGDDVILGGSGNDQIQGGAGEDRIGGGAGNDIMNGGAGNDIFVFIGSFGNDEIRQFDPNPVGGQDLIDLTGLGVTAANFNATVTITDTGPDVLITVGGAGTILLVNIANSALITQADFILL